jgi:hypothetical protein
MQILRLIRILILTAGVLVLLHDTRRVRAQTNHECITSFDTESQYCDSTCCKDSWDSFSVITGTSDTDSGQTSSYWASGSCQGLANGAPSSCTASACGSFQYTTTYTDSTCCQVSTEACDYDNDCCSGLTCNSAGICMTCFNTGTSCSGGADCCSGSCFAGTCCSPYLLNSCGVCGLIACDGSCNDPCGNGGGGPGCDDRDVDCMGDGDCCPGDICVTGSCSLPEGDPIIVDLSGAGFPLTNVQNGVKFDFFAKGKPIQMAWTAVGSHDGWLALDRNGNGRIDNGTELFSNVSPQPNSGTESKLGFRALAVYDQPASGGNGDGVIDQRDAVFSKLLVWVDKNHDGISEPGELLTLQQAGIQSISVHYEFSNWTDVYGNQFRYRSKIAFAGGGPAGDHYAYDVILVTAK